MDQAKGFHECPVYAVGMLRLQPVSLEPCPGLCEVTGSTHFGYA